MNRLLIGNAISLAGAILMVLSGLIKKKRKILLVQNVQFALMGSGNLILGSWSGMIANAVSIFRNFYCLKWDLTVWPKVFFIAVQAVLTIVTNHAGAIGYLPLAAAVAFTLVLDTKDERKLKAVIIFGQLCWLVHDVHFDIFTSAIFDVLSVISNLIGIWRLQRKPAE